MVTAVMVTAVMVTAVMVAAVVAAAVVALAAAAAARAAAAAAAAVIHWHLIATARETRASARWDRRLWWPQHVQAARAHAW